MVTVIQVTPLKNRLLQIAMSDGRKGFFNIIPYCTSDYFNELLQDEYLHQVHIFFGGIGWPHGQDIGPDTIAHDLVPAEAISIA